MKMDSIGRKDQHGKDTLIKLTEKKIKENI